MCSELVGQQSKNVTVILWTFSFVWNFLFISIVVIYNIICIWVFFFIEGKREKEKKKIYIVLKELRRNWEEQRGENYDQMYFIKIILNKSK